MIDQKIKSLIDQHDIISFDIFDTLLLRPYLNPYHLIKHIEEYTQSYGFYSARMNAEHLARCSCTRADITLDEIYERISEKFRHLKGTELKFERLLLRPRTDVQEIYNYAVSQGRRIAILSDMYLPRDFLADVLHKNRYDKWDFMYVSGTDDVAKNIGTMYQCLLRDSNTSPQRILHIGDSVESDVNQARKCGIHTLHVPQIKDLFFAQKANSRFHDLYAICPDSLTTSMILMRLVEKWHTNRNLLGDKSLYWHDFGYTVGGPVAYGLCKYMLDIAHRQSMEQVLFVARDGYTMRRVFDLIKSPDDNIESFYVYAQRMLRAKCLLDWGDDHNADLVLNQLRDAGVNIPRLSNYYDKQLFLKENIDILRDNADKSCDEYKKYLLNLGIDVSKNIIIADSGAATFSAQRLLSAVLGRNLPGMYSIITNKDFARENNISYNVWASDATTIENITSIIEFIFMAPEPPVVDIKNCAPVYQKNPHPVEILRNKIAVEISDGIVDFIKDFISRTDGLQISFPASDTNQYVRAFCCDLSDLDKLMLGSINSPSNASHTEYKQNLLRDIRSYGLVRYGEVFNIPIMRISCTVDGRCIYFFGLPIFRIKKRNMRTYVKIFGKLPLVKIIKNGTKTKYMVFGVIRVFTMRSK